VEASRKPFHKADNHERIRSVLLSVDLDARAMRDTLLNQAIREVHTEVDDWRATQRTHLISAITDTIISEDPSTETLAVLVAPLDPRLQTWIDAKKDQLRGYARSRLANQACEDTLDQKFTELVEERIHQHRKALDSEVATRSADLRQTFDNELNAYKAALQTDLDTAKAQIRTTLNADIEAARLEAHDRLTQELGKLRHEHKVKITQERDDLDTRALASVMRTPKSDKPSPLQSRPKKLKRKPVRKTGVLEFTPSPHPSDDDMVTDDESVTDTIHSPTAIKAAEPLPASRPTSTTPTQPVFAPKADVPISVEQAVETEPAPVSAPPAAAPIVVPPTPTTNVSLEMTMLLQAFTGFKTEITTAISDLNTKVLQLQTGTVPSSQPFADYGDFDLQERSDWTGMAGPVPHADDADFMPVITEADRKAEDDHHTFIRLFDNLVKQKILVSSGPDDHELFADHMRLSTFVSRSWPATADPTPEQLEAITLEWREQQARLSGSNELNCIIWTYNALTQKSYHAASPDEQDRFAHKFRSFCADMGYDPAEGMPSANHAAFRRWKAPPYTPVQPATSSNSAPKIVRFSSAPPIDTLEPAPSSSVESADEFPPLAPISFATVTRRRRRRSPPTPAAATATTTPSAIASTLLPPSTSPSPPTKPIRPPPRPLPDALSTTEYTVILDANSTPAFPEHIKRDPSGLVRSVQNNLKTKAAEIKVVSGRWSSQEIKKNFIFKLEGKPSLDTISKYNDILFRPFGPNCRAAPTEGYRQVILGWVLVLRDEHANPVSSSTLKTELMRNKVCAGRRIFSEPRWLGSKEHLAGKVHASVVFSFYDPDGDGFELMRRSPPYLFGRETTV
jgi:hypothetical protein